MRAVRLKFGIALLVLGVTATTAVTSNVVGAEDPGPTTTSVLDDPEATTTTSVLDDPEATTTSSVLDDPEATTTSTVEPTTTTTTTAETTSTTSLATTTVAATTTTVQPTTTTSTTSVPQPQVPGPPRMVSATPLGASQVRLSFQPPASDGGSPVIGYRVERSVFGGPWLQFGGVHDTTGSVTVTGLAPATRYYFRAIALNAVGAGAPSGYLAANTPATVPGAPRLISATPGGLGQIRIAYAQPASNGGSTITTYVVERSTGGGLWTRATVTGNPLSGYLTVNGLSNGIRYDVRVRAVNAVGAGAASAPVAAVTLGVPGAPRLVAATPAGPRQLRVAFTQPASNGGSAITTYVVERSTYGGPWSRASVTGNPLTGYLTVNGLSNGTRYYLRVRAVNVVGLGAPSGYLAATTLAAPSAPRNLSAAPGSGRVTISWAAPASTGGAAVTRYVVQRSTSPSTGWLTIIQPGASTRSYVSTGLTGGRRYYFRVAAVNAVGAGPWSATASAVPPPAVAPPPPPPAPSPGCHPSYIGVCLPSSGPDLDCSDIPVKRFRVVGPDTYRLDADNDGIACEA